MAAASITTALSAVDGAVCAEQSGGNWYDGAMAGAIGGSFGSFVSSVSNPIPGTDTALRLNVAGRIASSLTYDITYDLFSKKEITSTNVAMYAVDVTTDAALSTVYYHYSGNLSNSFLGTYINGFLDGVVDVFQTFFTQ